jgi:hypothetical protein
MDEPCGAAEGAGEGFDGGFCAGLCAKTGESGPMASSAAKKIAVKGLASRDPGSFLPA